MLQVMDYQVIIFVLPTQKKDFENHKINMTY